MNMKKNQYVWMQNKYKIKHKCNHTILFSETEDEHAFALSKSFRSVDAIPFSSLSFKVFVFVKFKCGNIHDMKRNRRPGISNVAP